MYNMCNYVVVTVVVIATPDHLRVGTHTHIHTSAHRPSLLWGQVIHSSDCNSQHVPQEDTSLPTHKKHVEVEVANKGASTILPSLPTSTGVDDVFSPTYP